MQNLVFRHEKHLTKIKNIRIKNVDISRSEYGIWIRGDEKKPIHDILLENVEVKEITRKGREVKHVENIQKIEPAKAENRLNKVTIQTVRQYDILISQKSLVQGDYKNVDLRH